MRRLYSALTMLLAPLAFAAVLCRGLRDRSYWLRPLERFGFGPIAGASPSIWLHAVSLGEVGAAAPLVRALRERHPATPFVVSTATPTGRARAQALFGEEVSVRFLPYDTPGAVARFLRRVRPGIAIIMETELWPNLLRALARCAVPVVLANARITVKSAARYRRLGTLFSDAVASLALIGAQTSEDAERFIALGAERTRTQVIGNVKFDVQLGDEALNEGRRRRSEYLAGRPVWIAGSTHEGEEIAALAAQEIIERKIEDALLVLVPRHPQRFESVANLLLRRGVRFDRRSTAGAARPRSQVLLVDSVGELPIWYAAADAAFVGGSLVPIGGHNLLEPAALGVPVITGPHNANGKEIAAALLASGGAAVVADAAELAARVQELLADPRRRELAGARAREFVERHRGSVLRLLALIEPLLAKAPGPPAAGHPSAGR